jgi:ADP-ribose pyrophosphatase
MGDVLVWRQRESVLVHATPWFDVHRDTVIRPDGVSDTYHHVATRGSVTVLAMGADDQVLLTTQWIYTHRGRQWRLPGGGIEEADAGPRFAAGRELAEETGLHAARWDAIGEVNGADSFSNHVDHVFLARDLTPGEPRLDAGEADLTVHWLPFTDALAMVTAGDIHHAGSIYALLSMGMSRASADGRF